MLNSFKAVLSDFKTHILYLRKDRKPITPLIPLRDVTDPLPHEKLLEILEQKTWDRINEALPLDSWENPLYSYGNSFQKYTDNVVMYTDILKKGHTLTKKEILGERQLVDAASFFITSDRFYESPRVALQQLLYEFKQFAIQVERINASPNKTNTIKYNLALSLSVISDMLSFVECLRIDSISFSSNPKRNR